MSKMSKLPESNLMKRFSLRITTTQVTEKLLELAAANPDAVYEKSNSDCEYTKGEAAGRKGCLFGQALMDLGISVETLKDFEKGRSQTTIIELSKFLKIKCDKNWEHVQHSQDNKVSWGDAVKPLQKLTK